MIARDHQYLALSPTDDEIEEVRNVSAKDAQVCGRRIGECGELAVDADGMASLRQKLNGGTDQHGIGLSANPAQRGSGVEIPCRQLQSNHERCTEHSSIRSGINQKIIGDQRPIGRPN